MHTFLFKTMLEITPYFLHARERLAAVGSLGIKLPLTERTVEIRLADLLHRRVAVSRLIRNMMIGNERLDERIKTVEVRRTDEPKVSQDTIDRLPVRLAVEQRLRTVPVGSRQQLVKRLPDGLLFSLGDLTGTGSG